MTIIIFIYDNFTLFESTAQNKSQIKKIIYNLTNKIRRQLMNIEY